MESSTEKILKKYSLKLYELFYHYILLSGELPSKLAEKVFTKRNIYYITQEGTHKTSFRYYRANNLHGYQLTKKGEKRVRELNYDYTPYISSTTKEKSKRIRRRNRAFLYHFLDLADIEYLNERINRNDEKNTFVDSRQLKGFFKAIKESFAHSPDREHQISSSEAYGVIELENKAQYISYIFFNQIEELTHGTESKFFITTQDFLENDNTGEIIFTSDTAITNALVQKSVICMLEENNKDRKKFSYFMKAISSQYQNDKYLGMHIISLNELGQNQFKALKNKTEFEKTIRKKLYNNEQKHIYNAESINYDGEYNGIPCVFLYSLDLCKLYKTLKYLQLKTDEQLTVVCFKEHLYSIRYLFDFINNQKTNPNISYLTLEELNLV